MEMNDIRKHICNEKCLDPFRVFCGLLIKGIHILYLSFLHFLRNATLFLEPKQKPNVLLHNFGTQRIKKRLKWIF